MRGKLYYAAQKVTFAAPAVLAFPLLWRIVTSFFFKSSGMMNDIGDETAMTAYVYIFLAGKALIPAASAISLVIAVIGAVLSMISKKKNDVGAGKLLITNIVTAVVTGVLIGLTFHYIGIFIDALNMKT